MNLPKWLINILKDVYIFIIKGKDNSADYVIVFKNFFENKKKFWGIMLKPPL